MRFKRLGCKMLFGLMLLSTLCINAYAVSSDGLSITGVEPRASGQFTVRIGGGETAQSDTYFPLSARETVRIDAIFSPENANLDVGLAAPDGYFYYINIDGGGDIEETIRVEEMGNYALMIQNNSDEPVTVTGFVYY